MTGDLEVAPVVLRGEWVVLEPLTAAHVAEIADASADGNLGDLWYTTAPSSATAGDWVAARLANQQPSTGLTFVARRPGGKVIGSTSYLNVDGRNRRVEIGHTWFSESVRRTGVNTEAKLLMLTHAFETLGAVGVELRTHVMNSQSRAAIERLGAKLDGVLRSHMLLADGSRRDTAVYSIIDVEWPAVRNNLRFKLTRGGRPAV
jgi:N-acetyltransferase